MAIESIMYFALGLLVAGLVALLIMPAIWNRAVRLTKKRIEAATPMTMAEFRADKDQLRAEFALSTRRLEMNVEALRKRLAEQLREINRKKGDLSAIKGDRDSHLTMVRELEERESELRRRVVELEKESADLSATLRVRDREHTDTVAALASARAGRPGGRPVALDGKPLSGDYDEDVAHLLVVVSGERKRIEFLEAQTQRLLTQLESTGRRTDAATATAAGLRRSLAATDDEATDRGTELIAAEARIADAESRISSLLTEAAAIVDHGEQRTGELLAEKLSLEGELEQLRTKVQSVEATVLADWDSERIEQSHLREKLNDIAADVSRLVYQVEGRDPPEGDETLYDRVQRFADDGQRLDEVPVSAARRGPTPRPSGAGIVSDRLSALRGLQQDGT